MPLISVNTSKLEITTWRHCDIVIFLIEKWLLTTITIFRQPVLSDVFSFSFFFFLIGNLQTEAFPQ